MALLSRWSQKTERPITNTIPLSETSHTMSFPVHQLPSTDTPHRYVSLTIPATPPPKPSRTSDSLLAMSPKPTIADTTRSVDILTHSASYSLARATVFSYFVLSNCASAFSARLVDNPPPSKRYHESRLSSPLQS